MSNIFIRSSQLILVYIIKKTSNTMRTEIKWFGDGIIIEGYIEFMGTVYHFMIMYNPLSL